MQLFGQDSGGLNVYFQILKDFWPLAAITGALTMALGLRNIKQSYMQRTPLQVFINLLFSALISSVVVICILCLAEWVLPPLSPKLEVGVALFVGIFGVKGIDFWLKRLWGISALDVADADFIASLRNGMSEQERQVHVHNCPFKSDMHKYIGELSGTARGRAGKDTGYEAQCGADTSEGDKQ